MKDRAKLVLPFVLAALAYTQVAHLPLEQILNGAIAAVLFNIIYDTLLSRKLRWFALCPVIDSMNHQSTSTVRLSIHVLPYTPIRIYTWIHSVLHLHVFECYQSGSMVQKKCICACSCKSTPMVQCTHICAAPACTCMVTDTLCDIHACSMAASKKHFLELTITKAEMICEQTNDNLCKR